MAGLQENFARLGFSSAEINKVTESTLALAQAADADLARSAEVAGSTLRGFGLEASQTGRVTDVMASSFGASALDLESFAESMKFVAPVANSAGISLEETTAMLASLANAGVKGSQAGTSLKRIISELGATGGDVSGAISKLASEGLNLADAKDEVGRTAQTALLVLSKSGEQTAKLTGQFQNSAGAAKDMAAIMDNTSSGALARMRSAIEGAQIKLGKALAPTILRVVKFVERLATGFSSLSPTAQKFALAGAAIAAALGPILILLTQMVAAFGVLTTTVLPAIGTAFTTTVGAITWPIGLIIGAVVGLVLAFKYMWDDIKPILVKVANYFIKLYNESETLRVGIAVFGGVVKGVFIGMKTQLLAVFKSFSLFAKVIKTAFTDGFGAAYDVATEGIDEIANDITEGGEQIYKNFVDGIESARTREPIEFVTEDDIQRGVDRIKSLIPTFGGGGGSSSGSATGGTSEPAKMQARTLDTGAAPTLLIPPAQAEQSAKALTAFNKEVAVSVDLSQGIADGFVGIAEGIAAMASGTLTFKGFMGGILKSLGALLSQLGSAFVSAGVAAKQFYANLIANPPAAIAAGIALVAAGALVKGIGNRLTAEPPKLASGGIAFGRSLVEVGEYSGARANPEVIAPLDKLQNIIGNVGGNGGTVQVQGVLRGEDLYLATSKARRNLSASRGSLAFGGETF